MKYALKILLFLLVAFYSKAQCPTADFNVGSEFCLGESIVVENLSIGDEFYWNLCPDIIQGNYAINTWNSGSNAFRSTYTVYNQEYEDNWYGFVVRNNGEAYRFGYNTSTNGINDVTFLNSSTANLPRDFQVIEVGGDWYGLMTNSGPANPTLIEFGNDLLNTTPTYSNIALSSNIFNTNGLKLFNEGGDAFALVGGNSSKNLFMLDFDTDLTLEPSVNTFQITDATNIVGIDLLKECDYWYGLVTSRDNSKLFRLIFDNGLTSSPTIEEITISDPDYVNPAKVKIVNENGFYYAFVQLDAGEVFKLDFESSISNEPVSVAKLAAPSNSCYGIDVSLMGGQWNLTSVDNVNATKGLFGYTINSSCEIDNSSSTEFEPTNLSLDSEGNYTLRLVSSNPSGSTAIEKSFTVNASTAPNISFSVDDSRCIENANIFESIDDGDITTYSWDFNEDGIEDSSDPNPSYNFSGDGPGSYMVSLSVLSNEGCTNTFSQEISIYASPSSPDFDYSAATLCSNSDITFSNLTSENGSGDVITYLWDFNGEDTSNEKDPVYEFTSAGIKTVSLSAMIPGCTTTVYSEDIEIIEGPTVDFSYANNCFGEAIQFIDASSGTNITDYFWDFGDSNSSTDQNPTHTYASTGDYEVSLTVSNGAGCVTISSQTIEVTNDPKAEFNYGTAIENLPVTFSGQDLTIDDDEVTSWNWDFDGIGMSDLQNPTYIFEMPGDYQITLFIETLQGCSEEISKTINVTEATCPVAIFDIEAEYCQEEQVEIQNLSVNASEFFWTLNEDQLASNISEVQKLLSSELTQVYALDFIDSTRILGIRNNGVPYLYTLNDSLTDTDNVVTYNDPGIFSSLPRDLKTIWIENHDLVALYTNSSGSAITRAVWSGGDFTVEPSYDLIEEFTPSGGSNGLELIKEYGTYFALVGENGSNELNILDFGSDLLSTPSITTYTVSDVSGIQSIALTKECGLWEGLIISSSDNRLIRLTWEEGLLNPPISSEVPITAPQWDNPTKVKLVIEQGYYYAFVQLLDSDIFRFSFHESLYNAPVIESFSGLSSGAYAIEVVQNKFKQWKLLAADYFANDGLYSAGFTNTYDETLMSNETAPIFSFSNQGNYILKLIAFDEDLNFSTYADTITILPSTAPSISFTTDESRCIDNPNTFTSIDEGDIVFYSWDFDSDGIEDSSDPNPTYQFPAPGTYQVRLTVESDAGCGNFVEEEITIYPEPPVPSFSVSASTFCEGSEIQFTNTTDDSAYDGLVQYEWSVTDLGDTITSGDLTYAFQSAGEKIITVKSMIPGCESINVSETIVLEASPSVDFTASSTCEGDLTTFTNNSDAGTSLWDFGDGFTSTETNPDHLYTEAGSYNVSLTTTNSNGCSTTLEKQLNVSYLPEARFEYGQLCENDLITFMDISTVTGSSINSWEWYMDDALVSEEQNPELTFDETGLKTMRLVVFSDNGCEASYSETISIFEKPQPNFSVQIGCEGATSTFIDTSENPDQISSRIWMVDGDILATNTQEFNYTFEVAGTYDVTLVIDNADLCSDEFTQTVNVPFPPQLDFEVAGSCINENLIATDHSEELDDEIISREWTIDNVFAGNGSQVILPVSATGMHMIKLSVETLAGCQYELEKEVEILSVPDADFDVSNNYGVPPFTISFSNASVNASQYTWYVDNEPVSTEVSPQLSFTNTGSKNVKLVAQNANGCVDSTTYEVRSVEPIVDVSLNTIQVVENAGSQQILLDVTNSSNLPIEQFFARVELQNDVVITETITSRVEMNQEKILSLNLRLPISESNLDYLCVSLGTIYETDINPLNNENCINILPEFKIESPYPNPTRDKTEVRAILPKSSDVKISVIDLTGQVRYEETLFERPEGLNTFIYDLEKVRAGTYFLILEFDNSTFTSRIIKN